MLRILIADDERVARNRLRRLIEPMSDCEIIAECATGAETVAAVEEHNPDLLLLDIQMPAGDGFDVLSTLGSRRLPLVVFITAYDEHALRAFDACAIDYLLKPVAPERLARTFERIRDRLTGPVVSENVPSDSLNRFAVRSGGRVSFVSHPEIEWIEAAGNYAILHAGGKNHLIRETMASLEKTLGDSFLRLSRSALVNLRYVAELSKNSKGEHFAVLPGGQQIAITRSIKEVAARLRALSPSDTYQI